MSDSVPRDPEDILAALYEDVLVGMELETLERPHIVICQLPGTNADTYLGPFPTGLDALIGAQDEADRTANEGPFEYQVAALMRPTPPDRPHA